MDLILYFYHEYVVKRKGRHFMIIVSIIIILAQKTG